MLPRLLYQLALFATSTLATTNISPLFHLASTSNLTLLPSDRTPNPDSDHVYRVFYRLLSTCPTTHYAVIVEPSVLSYPSTSASTSFIPSTPNIASHYIAHNYPGQVNINFVLNVILMDCLNHQVLHVRELDDRSELPELDAQTIRNNILYVNHSHVEKGMGREEYVALAEGRKRFAEKVVDKYFGGEDYTLIYVRESEVPFEEEFAGDGSIEHSEGGDRKEIPLVGEH